MGALAQIEADASPTLNHVLKPFWQAARNDQGEPIRNRVLYGGRSSSKSWDAAGFAIFLAQAFTVKFLCARQFQNKIEESVYTLLVATIDRYGLRDQFRILENKIIHRRTGSASSSSTGFGGTSTRSSRSRASTSAGSKRRTR
jgi:phage terminase large subunit